MPVVASLVGRCCLLVVQMPVANQLLGLVTLAAAMVVLEEQLLLSQLTLVALAAARGGYGACSIVRACCMYLSRKQWGEQKHVNAGFFEACMAMGDAQFRANFRMEKSTFQWLEKVLWHHITKGWTPQGARQIRKSPLTNPNPNRKRRVAAAAAAHAVADEVSYRLRRDQ